MSIPSDDPSFDQTLQRCRGLGTHISLDAWVQSTNSGQWKQRALDVARGNGLQDITVNEAGTRLDGTCQGSGPTSLYRVGIKILAGTIKNSCNCPDAEKNHHCKHALALLYWRAEKLARARLQASPAKPSAAPAARARCWPAFWSKNPPELLPKKKGKRPAKLPSAALSQPAAASSSQAAPASAIPLSASHIPPATLPSQPVASQPEPAASPSQSQQAGSQATARPTSAASLKPRAKRQKRAAEGLESTTDADTGLADNHPGQGPAPKTDLELLAEADLDPDVILKVAQEVRWREGNVADLEDLALEARPADATTAGQQGGTGAQPAARRGEAAGSSRQQRSPSPKRRWGAEVGRRAPAARVQELVLAEAEDYSSDATVDLSTPQLAQTGRASPDTADTREVSPENMPNPLQRLRAQGAQSLVHAMETEGMSPASAGVSNSAAEVKAAEPQPAPAKVAIQQSGTSLGQNLLAAILGFQDSDDDL